jgi:hypothetical protein
VGFFKSIIKSVSKIQPFKQPLRVVAAVSTLGQSEVFRALPKPVQSVAVQAAGAVASLVTMNPAPLALAKAYDSAFIPKDKITYESVAGGEPMAFNVGQFLGGVSQTFGGSSNPYLSGFGQIAGMASAFVPQAAAAPVVYAQAAGSAYPVSNTVNLPAKIPTSGMTKDIFDAASKLLARLGIPVRSASGFIPAAKRALSGVASLARRTPAGTVISLLTGLGLTAMEANLLVSWQAQRRKHRRMNPANSKALRRAARRIKSFHKLCTHTDLLKTHHRRPAVGRKCR